MFFIRTLPAMAFLFYVFFALISSLFFYPRGIVFAVSLLVNLGFMIGIYLLANIPDYGRLLSSIHRTLRILAWMQLLMAFIQFTIPQTLPAVLQPVAYGVLDWFRITGFFRDPTYFAFFMATCIFWNIFIKGKNRFIFLENCLFLIAIILSGSFTVVIGLVASYVVLLIVQRQTRLRYILYGLLICVLIIPVILLDQNSMKQIQHKSSAIVLVMDPRYNARTLHLMLGMDMLKDKPVFGHGYGAFPWESEHYFPDWFYKSNYYLNKLADGNESGLVSHVLYATVMAEMGLIGLILVVIFIGGTLIKFLRIHLRFKDNISLFFLIFWVLFSIRTLAYGFRLSDGFVLMHFALGLSHIYSMRHKRFYAKV